MRMAHPERTTMYYWLIDMGYVVKAARRNLRLDYTGAKAWLEKHVAAPVQPIIFNSVDKRRGVEGGLHAFYKHMREHGFIVNLYQMEGEQQKQVDVAIASQAVAHAMTGSDIILTSGDIDMLPACQVIREMAHRRLILVTYDHGVHDELSQCAAEHLFFEDYPAMLLA